jgi:BMP and activin membrane-bound inhibitor (BAMBI) N-terminal domain
MARRGRSARDITWRIRCWGGQRSNQSKRAATAPVGRPRSRPAREIHCGLSSGRGRTFDSKIDPTTARRAKSLQICRVGNVQRRSQIYIKFCDVTIDQCYSTEFLPKPADPCICRSELIVSFVTVRDPARTSAPSTYICIVPVAKSQAIAQCAQADIADV